MEGGYVPPKKGAKETIVTNIEPMGGAAKKAPAKKGGAAPAKNAGKKPAMTYDSQEEEMPQNEE